MVSFQFNWHKKERNPVDRTTVVTVSRQISDIKVAAQAATQIFRKSFGSLKQNEIVSIYPLNKDGEPFGDPITLAELGEK